MGFDSFTKSTRTVIDGPFFVGVHYLLIEIQHEDKFICKFTLSNTKKII
jgi:hypothetical protein